MFLSFYKFAKRINDFRKIYFSHGMAIIREKIKADDDNSFNEGMSGQLQNKRYQEEITSYLTDENQFLIRRPVVLEDINWLVKIAMSNLPKNARILDVGCGFGLFGKVLLNYSAAHDWSYYGIEPSEQSIELCRSFTPRGIFKVGTAQNIPFADNYFDLVIISGVLQCLGDEWTQALKECARVSRGCVAILRIALTKDELGFFYRIIMKGKNSQSFERHTIFNQAEFENALQRCSLQILERSRSKESVLVYGCARRIPMYRYLVRR